MTTPSIDSVAVVVPVFNVAPYLERCVKTLVAQTYKNIEIILVDDKSTDSSSEICDELKKRDSRVRVVHRLQNGGLSAARNDGIAIALKNPCNKWMTFVDSDDWIHPRMIELLVEGAKKNNVEVAVCGYERVIASTEFINVSADFKALSPEEFIETCSSIPEKGIFIQNIACAKLFSAASFEKVRFPDDVHAHEDVYTIYKVIFAQGKMAFTDASLYFYFINPNSITGSRWSENRLHTVWGHQAQIEFFDANGYRKALNIAVRQQIKRIPWAINKCLEANGYEREVVSLKELLKQDFYKYKREFNLSLVDFSGAWKILSPCSARCYMACEMLFIKIPRYAVRKILNGVMAKQRGVAV